MKQFIGTMLLGLAVTATPCAAQITGGNPAVSAANVDAYYNFSIVDTNNPISGTGTLDSWNVFTTGVGQVDLLIVTPGTYTVVGESGVVTTAAGMNTFTLSTPISVTAGDYVGFWEGNLSTVEYITGSTPQEDGVFSYPVLYTTDNSGLPLTSVGPLEGSGQRAYSINVSGTLASVPEGGAAFMYLLLAGAACFGAVVFGSRKGKASAFQA